MSHTALEIYVEETDQHHGRPLHAALIELARDEGLSGATAFRGIMGFGVGRRIHSLHLLDVAENLPVMIKVIDSAERIAAFVLKVREIAPLAEVIAYDVRWLER